MSRFDRVKNIIIGLFMIAWAAAIVLIPTFGYPFIVVTLCITLVVRGVRSLVYYFTMARHMVGGLSILYIAILVLQLGLFALSLSDVPRLFVTVYLVGAHAYDGVIAVLRAFEEKALEYPKWKMKMLAGAMNIAVALAALVCGILIESTAVMVYIYGAGLVYSAVIKIVSAFRKTSVVYIQP